MVFAAQELPFYAVMCTTGTLAELSLPISRGDAVKRRENSSVKPS
jgi:hypothetical protein